MRREDFPRIQSFNPSTLTYRYKTSYHLKSEDKEISVHITKRHFIFVFSKPLPHNIHDVVLLLVQPDATFQRGLFPPQEKPFHQASCLMLPEKLPKKKQITITHNQKKRKVPATFFEVQHGSNCNREPQELPTDKWSRLIVKFMGFPIHFDAEKHSKWRRSQLKKKQLSTSCPLSSLPRTHQKLPKRTNK